MDTLGNIIKSLGAGSAKNIIVNGAICQIDKIPPIDSIVSVCYVVIPDDCTTYRYCVLANVGDGMFNGIVTSVTYSIVGECKWLDGSSVGDDIAKLLRDNEFKFVTFEPTLVGDIIKRIAN